MQFPSEVVKRQESRGRDVYGPGQFKARRGVGSHEQLGLDVVAQPGEIVYSPIQGTIIPGAMPCKNDPSVHGVVIEGAGYWKGYQVSILYMEPTVQGPVVAGQAIGYAQDVQNKFRGLNNHVQVQVRHNGAPVEPWKFFPG